MCDPAGRICGVIAESKEGECTITARSVIVATGGFGNNKEMLKKHLANYHETMTYDGPPSNTGDGIVMAAEIGAATAGMGACNLHGPFIKPKSDSHWMKMDASGPDGSPIRITLWFLAWEPGTLWVNKRGVLDEGHNLAFFAWERSRHAAERHHTLSTPISCAGLKKRPDGREQPRAQTGCPCPQPLRCRDWSGKFRNRQTKEI